MTTKTKDEKLLNLTYSFLIENFEEYQEAIELLISFNGKSTEVFNHIISYYTGCNNLEELYNNEKDNYYFSKELVKEL